MDVTIRYEQALRLAQARLTGALEVDEERVRDVIAECYRGLARAEELLREEVAREQANPRMGLRRG